MTRRLSMPRIEARIGYRFKERSWLRRALTHRSYAHAPGGDGEPDYERLEFLGDALLGMVVADLLWRSDAAAREGVLTRRKQVVVCSDSLARASRDLGLGEAMRLGPGEEQTGGRGKASLLADVFEAVLGAVYVDGGIRPARAFVRRHLGARLTEAGSSQSVAGDNKTRLQEETQARWKLTPTYRTLEEAGPPHRRTFRVAVSVRRRRLAVGEGSSRKQAEQQAAEQALQRLENTDE